MGRRVSSGKGWFGCHGRGDRHTCEHKPWHPPKYPEALVYEKGAIA